MSEPQNLDQYPFITVTKLNSSQRQFEAAIAGWFNDGDPVAVWTLAAAAHQVCHGIAKDRGLKSPLIFNDAWMSPEKYATFKKEWLHVENFFKHADPKKGEADPAVELTFQPDAVEFYLLDGLELFHAIGGHWSDIMMAFRARLAITYPSLFPRSQEGGLYERLSVKLATVPKQQFLKECFEMISLIRREDASRI